MPYPRTEIEIVGNLGKDPESRFIPTGELLVNFSLAVTRTWGQGESQKKEVTWWNITAWDKLAEACQVLVKGQQIMVKGYLKPDQKTGRPRVWTAQDGTVGASYELTAKEVWLSLFGKSAIQAEQSSVYSDQVSSPFPYDGDVDEDDIPF